MTNEFYDGAMDNMSAQQFNMPIYQDDYYGEDFEGLAEDVFERFEDYPNDRRYPRRYVRPYPIYPKYPRYGYFYHRRPIYRTYPRYNMYYHPMPRRHM